MNILLNNIPEEIHCDQMTIAELIRYKNFTFKLLITKINGELIKKEDRDKRTIKEGDNVLIIHMISGG
jgi:thiamine biosynthesis protein ThiS